MHFYFRLGYPHLPPLLLVGWVLHLHLPEVLLASLACCLEGTPLTLSLSLSLWEVTNNNNVICLQEFLLSDVSHSHCPSPNKVHWHWWLGSQWVGSKYSQNRLTSYTILIIVAIHIYNKASLYLCQVVMHPCKCVFKFLARHLCTLRKLKEFKYKSALEQSHSIII